MSDLACDYPNLAALSGYRYGCRCARCVEAQREWPRLRAIGPLHGPRIRGRRGVPRPQGREATCELCGWVWTYHGQDPVRAHICAQCLRPWSQRMKAYRLSLDLTLRM